MEEEILRESFRQKTWSEQATKDSWMVFKIMGEIVSGYEKMQKMGPCVSIFGSARIKPDTKYYKMTEEIAKKLLEQEEHFLIMNADILTNLNISNFINFHLKSNNLVTLAVSNRKSSRKLLFDSAMTLQGWRNEKTGEEIFGNTYKNLKPLAFSGIHCINSNLLKLFTRRGKFSIMEEYLDLMKNYIIKGYKHDALLIDVGKPESITEAEKYFK